MKRTLLFSSLLALLCLATAAFGQNDAEGSKDFPGIQRMPNYYIYQYSEAQFDSVKMAVKKNGKETEEAVEGHVTKIHYYLRENAAATSTIQVIRNYQNATRNAGGQVVDDQRGDNWYNTTLRLQRGNSDIWVLIEARSDNHELTIVERQAMQQEVVMDAASMASGLAESGKVDLYGIYFDTNSSTLKPESDAALAEVAKMLKQAPALKVFIVGHTDMVGDPAANVRLSQARAQSVVTALTTKYGIAATRLTAFGNGPYAPVGTNRTDDGRAKNRRVEIVEIATH